LIRPEHVVLTSAAEPGGATVNRFRGRVVQMAFLGEATEYVVQVGSAEILVRTISDRYDGSEDVDVYFPPEKMLAMAVDET
jgi:ABC-type Fe3+/spermidine/putrescine transport system ATPase subunit